MRVLVTGGAGYVGSHTMLELLGAQHVACVVDNYSNSSPEALDRVARLSNRSFKRVTADICNEEALSEVCRTFRPDAVIHFAGLKAVGESVEKPVLYYENNVQGTVALLKAMDEAGCRRIVFSSSATVYGVPQYLPFDEAHPCAPVNPYGRTKLFIEEMLRDWAAADQGASVALLRYFNPVGAHASGQIGEDPADIPNNLMPYVSQVAIGRRPALRVFGNDYDTPDGTGVRDYIHVADLARAHIAALDYVSGHTGTEAINVGTGKGASVLEVIRAFEAESGRKIPYEIAPRRPGDVAVSLADPCKASRMLDWEARLGLPDMCRSTWAWQSQNPNGYGD
jgi:UDP-glucose 4-epimerase